MSALLWNMVARFCARPAVADWLIKRSKRTPYFHLDGYMERWWLFNPTPALSGGQGRRFEWLPSVRIHHILREDTERHPHNHPWNARTIILKGWYMDRRDDGFFMRTAGDTSTIMADDFHSIGRVSDGGVWTLFISWRWKHTWGFRVAENVIIPWRDYLNEEQQ